MKLIRDLSLRKWGKRRKNLTQIESLKGKKHSHQNSKWTIYPLTYNGKTSKNKESNEKEFIV